MIHASLVTFKLLKHVSKCKHKADLPPRYLRNNYTAIRNRIMLTKFKSEHVLMFNTILTYHNNTNFKII